MSKTANVNNTNQRAGRWTPAEDEALMKAVKNKGNQATMTNVFDQFGLAHNRAAGSVAQHYYRLVKESSVQERPEPKMNKNTAGKNTKNSQSKNKNANPDISGMVNKIKQMPTQAVRSLSYIVNSMQVQ